MSVEAQFRTHEVHNQPEPMPGYNLWRSDLPLQQAIARHGAEWAADNLDAMGQQVGHELMEAGELANRHRPELHSFDRYGRRIDEVEFHPAYHQLMAAAMANQMHSFAWNNAERPGAHVARAGLMYLYGQADAGTCCPLTMTYASIPALRHSPELAAQWVPRLLSSDYDPRTLPAERKRGCTIGMGMTEKQGGSDVRSNTTQALQQPDGSYRLIGHKFFFSAPMCDAHLVLAQTGQGIGCFLLPRVLPDGSLNAVRIQRLKDKLGDWSNASSEVEFLGASAWLVGQEGRGVATILEMVALTRLDCMIGSASMMRQALTQALNHVRQRAAFGRLLIDQPLMRNVLADLALENEAAVALTMRVAAAVDASPRDEQEAAFARITTAIGKYLICKRGPLVANEAQECLGGLGYVEENILPRLYRQAPLNSIWEGSGNVQCLDVLRALRREPETRDALFAELTAARGLNSDYDRQLDWLAQGFADPNELEMRSRLLVERTGMALQASLLLRSSQPEIGDAFCRARLGAERGSALGCLQPGDPVDLLIDRAMPQWGG
ncbi:MAG: isovaleryl-CoA dehydrogenase [Pseudomonas formosensis]|nr:isovaleryl-CoA dehydrogenase [Halopseudomonas formosensis]